jgi:hypothetical protein
MPLINYSIPTLIGGVTQQPNNLSYPGQVDELENAWPSMVDGLQKRYPSEYHGFLNTTIPKDAKPAFHFIDKSTEERYLVALRGAPPTATKRIEVHNLLEVIGGNINQYAVRMSYSGEQYLDSADPEDYRFQTVGDVTYVVNRTKTPAMLRRVVPKGAPQVLMYVRATLASNSDEHVVVTFNGNTTAEINDNQASTTELTANILAAITGGDVSQGAVTIDKNSNKILQTAHNLTSGMAVRMTATTYPTWKSDETDSNSNSYEGSAAPTFYVRDVEANSFKLSLIPEGLEIHWYSNGSGVALFSLGTGSPPAGFEKLVVQHAEEVAQGSGKTSVGNVLLLSHADGEDFTLEVRDGAGNTLIDIYKDSAPSFSELPDTAVEGFTLQIRNDPATGIDDYFVRFVSDTAFPGELSSGYWEEVADPGLRNAIDPRTMPHILVRESSQQFAFMPAGDFLFPVYEVDAVNNRCSIRISFDGLAPSSFYHEFLEDGDQVRVTELEAASDWDVPVDKDYYAKVIVTASAVQTIELYHDEALTDQVTFGSTVTGLLVYAQIAKASDYPQFYWGRRQAGGELTNPNPTFVGTHISDVGFFKNRLAFAVGEHFVLSELGEFFNFYRTTVTQLLDTAPIDVASSWAGVADIDRLLPYGDGLLGIAPNVQFFLRGSGQQAFGANTVSVDVVSSLSTEPKGAAAPVLMGQAMYLPFTRGDYVGLYEYTPDGTGSFSHEDITDHVPQYVQGKLRDMAALDKENVIVALGTKDVTDGYKNTDELFVYVTNAVGERRVQSAWGKYTFENADIRALHFYDDDLYFVLCRTVGGSDTWEVNNIGFKTGRVDAGSKYLTHLDRRIQVVIPSTGAYDRNTGLTTVTSAGTYGFNIASPMEVVTADGERLPNQEALNDGVYTVVGDYSGATVWLGEAYEMKFKLPTQYVKQNTGTRGVVSLVQGRTQLRTMLLLHADTVAFNVQVSPLNRTPYDYPYNGQVLGAGRLKVGSIPISDSGDFKFPIYEKNEDVEIEITNDTPFPSNFVGAEVEVLYHARAGRVS